MRSRSEIGFVVLAAVVAVAGARPYAGGWNDGSRLAAAEAAGERGTLVIDGTSFPTSDKLLIDGRYYSDKPPVQAVLTGGAYRVWLSCGGPTAAERPDVFARFQTLLTSGLAYILAVGCVVRLGSRVGLTGRMLIVFGGAFAVATVAPAYSRHVNGHITQLAVASALCLVLVEMPADPSRRRLLLAGCLAGFGYTLDLGLGPGLLLATAGYCVAVVGRGSVLWVIVGAVPWLTFHHTLNYATGGTLVPANTMAEYLAWPDSPHTVANMTGGWKHDLPTFLLYGLDLLVGRKGFVLNNLPLWLVPGGVVLLWATRPATRPAVGFAVAWGVLGWFAYVAASNNGAGECLSVRWFVPFLAPGFWVVGLVLREYPTFRPDFTWLAVVGTGLGVAGWWAGPWSGRMPAGLWVWVAVAGVGCGVIRCRTLVQRPVMFNPVAPARRAA